MIEWKTIPTFPDYEASSEGDIKSKTRRKQHNTARSGYTIYKGKILKQRIDTYGYKQVCIYKATKRHTRTVHGLVARAFLGKKISGMYDTHHIDGNKTNNHISNLEYIEYRKHNSISHKGIKYKVCHKLKVRARQ